MRINSLLALVAIGCSSTHPPAVDRTDCSRCHTLPAIAEPPAPECVAPQNPHHRTEDNVPSCSSCHGTAAWCPAEATHSDFELDGAHGGWDCADCHLAISYDAPAMVTDPKRITCISCHWHSEDRTDPFHLGKGDYAYGEATCLADGCHEVGDR